MQTQIDLQSTLKYSCKITQGQPEIICTISQCEQIQVIPRINGSTAKDPNKQLKEYVIFYPEK